MVPPLTDSPRARRRAARTLAAALLGALLAGPALPANPETDADLDMEQWIKGPIRYIAEKDEVKLFKNLKSDEQRVLFIERFWARRDPTPDTLTNEYRQLFWERVQQANAQFIDAAKPGWLTDRGKIFILYGPPTEIEEHLDLETKATDRPGSGHGLIRWIYEGRPAGRRDVNPVVVVPFVREVGGEYRITYDPALSSVFLNALKIREERGRRMGPIPPGTDLEPLRSTLSVMLDLGKLQEVPPQEQVLLERVETIESYRTRPLGARADRFWHPDDEQPLVVLTIDVGWVSREVQPAVIARFTPRDATEQPRLLGEGSFKAVESGDGVRLAQGRIVLAPGQWDLTVMVADTATAETAVHREVVALPGPAKVMRFSDVVLAQQLDPLDYASLASWDEPFHLGPYRAVPRIDAEYGRGEPVQLVYAVEGGTPPFRLTYQLEGLELDGTWVGLGEPSTGEVTGATQAWEVATAPGWPLGDYRVRIEVRDSGERLITAQVPFSLVNGTPEPERQPPGGDDDEGVEAATAGDRPGA